MIIFFLIIKSSYFSFQCIRHMVLSLILFWIHCLICHCRSHDAFCQVSCKVFFLGDFLLSRSLSCFQKCYHTFSKKKKKYLNAQKYVISHWELKIYNYTISNRTKTIGWGNETCLWTFRSTDSHNYVSSYYCKLTESQALVKLSSLLVMKAEVTPFYLKILWNSTQ